MRARKRNPYWGQGLDKRQARRARRRAARHAERVRQWLVYSSRLSPWQEEVIRAIYGPGGPGRPPFNLAKAVTRPQGWAPPARAHLFGIGTLNVTELHSEIDRHAAYGRVHAIEEIHRELRQRGVTDR